MDGTNLKILIVFVLIIAVLIGILSLLVVLKLKGKNKDYSKNLIFHAYRFFQSVIFLKQLYNRTRQHVAKIYPADAMSINRKTVFIMLNITGIGLAGIILILIIGEGNIFFIAFGCYMLIVALMSYIKTSFTKMNKELLKQQVVAVTKLRHNYQKNRDVVQALRNTVYEVPYDIGLHMQKIYDIVTSAKMNYEIDKYRGTEPNEFMSMLLSACASVKENGDPEVDGKITAFMKNLNYIKEDIENELLSIDQNMHAFKGLARTAVIPVFAIKPLQWWAEHYMGVLTTYYNGIYGIVGMCVCFVVSIVIYNRICVLRDGFTIEEKTSSIWQKVVELPILRDVINAYTNKHYVKYKKTNESLQALGIYTGAKAFCASQFAYTIIVFFTVILVLFGANISQKVNYMKNFVSEFDDVVVPSEEYRKNMESIAEEYAVYFKNHGYTTEEMAQEIKDNTAVSSIKNATIVAEKITERIDKYNNTFFRYYYLFFAIIAALIAFYVPEYSLKKKYELVQLRQQEEVIQYQSIMLILMNMKGMNVSTILEWLERFSYCFREQIAQCRVSLNYGTDKALVTLKNQVLYEPFRDFIDNLREIDNVGVEMAFDEIRSDREYYREARKQMKSKNIFIKSNKAKMISMIPFYVVIAMMLVIPIVLYAFNLLSTFGQYM